MGLTNCRKFVVAWGCAALALVAALGFGAQAYADEPVATADSDMITVEAQVRGVNTEGWRVMVSYAKPQAGVPTEFTINVESGPTGPYQYQQGFISKDGAFVYDPSFGSFDPPQDSNVLSYEFVGTGRYEYQFLVQPVGKLNKRLSINIDVSGDGFVNVDAKAREIVDACLPNGNEDDYETALVLHDWIIDNVSYDYSFRNLGIEHALSGKPVTCEGYHAAYVKLLETAGLQTGRINGNGHVWTAVKMDGEWYHVDTTHDDVKDGLSDATAPGTLTKEQQAHLLFGLNDDIMRLVDSKHQWEGANSLENNYFIRTGDILEWSDPIANTILDKLNKKETSFTVKATNAGWAQKDFKDVINNLVAYELNQYEWTTDNQTADAVVHVSYADDYFMVNVFTVLPAEPKIVQNLVYNGKAQTGVTVPSTGSYALTGTTKATKAGTYTAQAVPGAGYAWDKLGDKKSRSYRWTIAPASIGSRGVAVSGVQSSYRYTGSAVKPVPRLTFNGTALTNGIDYTVSYANNVNAGTATMTITGKGNFQGTRKVAFSIEKATTPTTPSQPPATSKPSDKPSSVTKPSAPTVTKPTAAWKKSGGKWWYRHADGSYTRNDWERINGAWYHFDKAGWMQTGWLKTGGKWYYLSDSGAMKTGWLKSGGAWYYLKSSGAMATGWYKVGGAWYWSNSSGAMGANRWVGNYYLKSSGAMATNQWIGKYHVNGSGLWDRTR